MENEKELFLVLVAVMSHALVLRGDDGLPGEIVEEARGLANAVMELTSEEFTTR